MELGEPRLFPIERAGVDDAPALCALLRANAVWLQARGINQWREDMFAEAGIAREIASADHYVIRQGDRLLAAFRLQWSDRRFWGDDSEDGRAGYVHSLAVAREAAGQGIGTRLLDFAAERIAEAGRSLLRLDCWRDNERLCRYYADAGFRRVRDVELGVWTGTLWERAVALPPLDAVR